MGPKKKKLLRKKEILVYAKFAVETANRYYYSICTLYAEPWCFLPVVFYALKGKAERSWNGRGCCFVPNFQKLAKDHDLFLVKNTYLQKACYADF